MKKIKAVCHGYSSQDYVSLDSVPSKQYNVLICLGLYFINDPRILYNILHSSSYIIILLFNLMYNV